MASIFILRIKWGFSSRCYLLLLHSLEYASSSVFATTVTIRKQWRSEICVSLEMLCGQLRFWTYQVHKYLLINNMPTNFLIVLDFFGHVRLSLDKTTFIVPNPRIKIWFSNFLSWNIRSLNTSDTFWNSRTLGNIIKCQYWV